VGGFSAGTCCKSDVTDAAGVCCEPGKMLDVCGVCDGAGSTCAVASVVEYQVNVTDQNSIITGLGPADVVATRCRPVFITHTPLFLSSESNERVSVSRWEQQSHLTGCERMVSPTLQTLQDPILLLSRVERRLSKP
jgi:hypothetical protein